MADVRAMRTTSKQLKSARAHAWVRNQYVSFKGKPEDQVILVIHLLTSHRAYCYYTITTTNSLREILVEAFMTQQITVKYRKLD